MLIELVDWDDNYKFAHYDSFRVGSEDEGYIVSISGYTGTAGDSFSYVTNNTKFSTKKIDLDQWSLGSCAQHFGRYIILIAIRFIENMKKYCRCKLVV